VPASSLIFVIIVAIWAAYLLQHFARRRENAAAARSVDGFSEAMRVLEKRPVLPPAELAPPRPHSYSVTPARIARPTIDVKRAAPVGANRSHAPLLSRPSAPVETAPHHDPGPVRDGARRAPVVSRTQRRLRAALLLLSLLWVPVSIVLAATGVIRWLSVPFAVLTFVAVLVWLRTEVQADKLRTARRRVQERARGRRRRRAPAPVLTSDDTQVIGPEVAASIATALAMDARAAPAAHAAATAHGATAGHPATAARAAVAKAGSAAYDVFDAQAESLEVSVADAPGVHADGTWSPVPVPTPTYAMKSKAEPRWTESGIPADVFDTPEFADEADELDDRALFARRAVSE
jgi:hypothetical protein